MSAILQSAEELAIRIERHEEIDIGMGPLTVDVKTGVILRREVSHARVHEMFSEVVENTLIPLVQAAVSLIAKRELLGYLAENGLFKATLSDIQTFDIESVDKHLQRLMRQNASSSNPFKLFSEPARDRATLTPIQKHLLDVLKEAGGVQVITNTHVVEVIKETVQSRTILRHSVHHHK
ncbi:MAG: hypothetical protein ACD_45C00341G0003 [uncultured bacterium]|nr:MAG: hypothetical protein ACD_45C00341G0003 [uncultured bacterium]OGT54183.1 MAG: hypothetical protein A3F43_01655 [Gammaproteobacteria bacterium RIFCSPHIGHO2_12_FULL_42_10]